MTAAQIKQLEAGAVLIDDSTTSRTQEPIAWLVPDARRDGIICHRLHPVEQAILFRQLGNQQELLEWDEEINKKRINESGYLL